MSYSQIFNMAKKCCIQKNISFNDAMVGINFEPGGQLHIFKIVLNKNNTNKYVYITYNMSNINNEQYTIENENENENEKQFYVYCLLSTANTTYIGATINLERRLRQHNKELKGGAKLTGIQVNKGHVWSRICYISGFPTWNAALQFEWRWKNLSRKKIYAKYSSLHKRIHALYELVMLDKSTTNAIPFNEWSLPLKINYSSDYYFPKSKSNNTINVNFYELYTWTTQSNQYLHKID